MKPRHDKMEEDSRSEDGDDRSRSASRNDRNKDSKNGDILDHDALSIYIGNVDYSANEEDLRNAFIECGDIVRVTIIKNMKTGHPKGAAFIEFVDKNGVNGALSLNGKQVKGRPLTVTTKKPKPEKRQRDTRPPPGDYERRGPPRSGPPMYQMYPPAGRLPYGAPGPGGMARGGYYGIDTRRGGPGGQMPMQMDLQPRYDPYRRPEFYDPYMAPRGGPPMPPQQYYHPKFGPSGGAPVSHHHHSKGQPQPPVRYSNPYNRR